MSRSSPDPDRRCRGEDGAVLVEFALVSPLLFLILFGIIEFGWLFGNELDTRHATREASRLVAVNWVPTSSSQGDGDEDFGEGAEQQTDIVHEACKRMDLVSDASLQVSFPSGTDRGEFVDVTVRSNYDQLTGFFPPIQNITLSSTTQSRLEQPATFAAFGPTDCP